MSAYELTIFLGLGAHYSYRVAFDPLAEQFDNAAAPEVTVDPALTAR